MANEPQTVDISDTKTKISCIFTNLKSLGVFVSLPLRLYLAVCGASAPYMHWGKKINELKVLHHAPVDVSDDEIS